jgi:hypothetical protein
MPSYQVKQSSTAYPLVFLMIDSSDHISPKTGLSPTVTISKAGGSFASPSGAVSEIGNGWYKVAGNATDTATLGPLLLHATASGADPVDAMYEVVAIDPQSTAYGLSLAKTTNITGFNDIAATAIVSGGAITTSGGSVSSVLTLTTYTGNTPQTGDAYARLGAPSGVSIAADIATRAPSSTALSTAQWTNTRAGYLDNLSGGAVALASGVNLASTGLDAVVVETGLTAKQALQYVSAACFGVLSGAGTGTVVIKAGANSGTTRITAATDSSGNRTSVTLA